jgi:protocatechuate 3,4-dioxygenase beta subunit
MKKLAVTLLVVLCGIGVVTFYLTDPRIGREEPILSTGVTPPAESAEDQAAVAVTQVETVRNAVLAGGAYDAHSGAGVDGVALILRSRQEAPGARLETRTDPTGAFRFEEVVPGDYTLERLGAPAGYRIPMPNSEDVSIQLTFGAGEVREGVKLTLLSEVPLRGKVIEHRAPETAPAFGASVVLVGGPDFAELQETVAGEDGTFAFHGLGPLDSFHLTAEKDGFRTRTRDRPLSEEGQIDVVLIIDTCEDPASVSGRVVDLERRPLAQMRVLAQNGPPNSQMVRFDGFGMTDAEGRFKLSHLVPGSFNFNLTPHDLPERGYEWGRLKLEAGEEVTDLELVYDRVYSISGGVYDPEGEPIAGARIRGGGTAVTDANGQYSITRLGPHVYDLEASAGNHTDGRIRGVPAGSDKIDFVLTPSSYEIYGRVLDAETHEPLTEFELSWDRWPESWGSPHLHSGNIYRYRSFSSPDGSFRIEDSRRVNWASKLLLVARAKGSASAFELIDLNESGSDDKRAIYLKPDGDLRGLVRDAEGAPVAAAEIYYHHVVRKIDHFDVERALARTADDGSFTIASFPQERQEIAIDHADFAPYFVEVPPHERRTGPLEITMTQGGVVRGRVIPVPEASSIRVVVSQDPWRTQRTEVKPDGTFVLEKVSPQKGAAQLWITHDDLTVVNHSHRFALIDRPVTVEVGKTTEIDFRLAETTSAVQGKIQLGDLKAETVRVEAVFTTESGVEKHHVLADADGTYLLNRLPPGDATVTVTAQSQSGNEKASSPVRMRIGSRQTLTCDFDLSQ